MDRIKTVVVGGVDTARLSRRELVSLLAEDCHAAGGGDRECRLVFDLNGHGLALAQVDADFDQSLRRADIIHADGQSIVVASRLLTKCAIPERSATTDLFLDVAEVAAKSNLRLYLLGGSESVNAACVARMRESYPGLKIVGRRHGFFAEAEEHAICEEINELKVDILWVGLGKPIEQIFCTRNRHRLNARWAVTCGGCFNYVVGEYPRAPVWMRSAGLEWLHRMVTRPRQLLWRYVTTNPIALYLLLTRTRTPTYDLGG